jgi:hypothetical protein
MCNSFSPSPLPPPAIFFPSPLSCFAPSASHGSVRSSRAWSAHWTARLRFCPVTLAPEHGPSSRRAFFIRFLLGACLCSPVFELALGSGVRLFMRSLMIFVSRLPFPKWLLLVLFHHTTSCWMEWVFATRVQSCGGQT